MRKIFDSTAESIDRLQADLALFPDTTLPDWLVRRPVFKSPYVVVARAGNPGIETLAPDCVMPFDLFCGLPHVLFSPQGDFSAQSDAALERIGRSRRVVMTVPVFAGVCRVVRESDLIALLPLQLARRVEQDYELRLFQPPIDLEPIQLVGVWHRKAENVPLAAWMRKQVFDILEPLDDYPGLGSGM